MPHGTRRSYAAGCHCFPCRVANATYRPPCRVSADPVRLHLAQLRAAGVGTRALAFQTGIARRVIVGVLDGSRTRLQAATAAALLLARPVLAPGARVPGTKTWRYVDSLEREGFTRRELAFRLGCASQQLQLAPKRIRASSALRMAALYARLADA